MLEGLGDEEQPVLKTDFAVVGDSLEEEVAGVLLGRQDLRIGARRWAVAGGGRLPVQRRVRPLLIVLGPKPIERALLGRGVAPGWADRPALQGAVHPLVGPVLLRPAGVNALMLNP